jgi:leucyl/phenylalanyl-tRNA---protein transferase
VDERPAAVVGAGSAAGPDPFATLDVAGAPRELVALGGALDPATLLSAYRHGCFPWPPSGRHAASLQRSARSLARRRLVPVLAGGEGLVPWCSPDPRAVLLAEQVLVSRSLRRRLRRCGWTTTLDTAFEHVVEACADRQETWITGQVRRGFAALHHDGAAHSLEVWDGEQLVGGLYGVLVGRVFCGESMFHRSSDASKVALVDLCHRLLEAGVQLVDVQQETEHLASLGAVLVTRAQYLHALARLRDESVRLDPDRRPVSRLVG